MYENAFNLLRVYGILNDKVLCKSNKFFSADLKDLQLVEAYTWHVSKGYAATRINKNIFYFHNMKFNFVPTDERTVDHVNHDRTYDNRSTNLDVNVTRRVQAINQGINKRNTSGVKGVSKGGGRYHAFIVDENGNRRTVSFSIKKHGEELAKQKAIDQRKEWESEVVSYAYVKSRK